MVDKEKPIAPIAFEPLAAPVKKPLLALRPLSIILALLLAAALAAVWFLLTARSVVIPTTPAGAEVKISGGLVFNLSGHYLLRPGNYNLEVTAPGYHPLQQPLRVTKEDNQRYPIHLKKMPGHLALSSEPAGASVTLDNEPRGETPIRLEALSPGEHQLLLTTPRYFPTETPVTIEGLDKTQTLSLSLKPAWGRVSISSNPTGAAISVGGQPQGETPATVEVLESGELVSVKLPGYKQWQRQLRVKAGETLDLETIELQPADGLVQVISHPAGAGVTVDGQYRGKTPLELELAPGRSHQISFFLDGYNNLQKSLSIASGTEQQLEVHLVSNTGLVRVIAQPKDAKISIDGQPRGAVGQTFKLPARPHRLEISRPGYASQTRTITPRPGLDQVVEVKLLTEEEARWAATPQQISSPAGQTLKLFRPNTTFKLGASRREPGRRANEVERLVRLSRAFYLGTHEVTNAQFRQFRRQHSSLHVKGVTLDNLNQPVVYISWQDAALYCNWLSGQEGLPLFYQESDGKITGINPGTNGYRLPTEAEWAWAARVAANDSLLKYPWGNGFPPLAKAGNFADGKSAKLVGRVVKGYDDGFATTAPVGSFPANGKGLYDLGGNVAEWVQDYYGIELNLSGKANDDPLGPESGEFRVIRGSSWRHSSVTELRLSFRDYGTDPRDDVGFRIARYVEAQ